MFKNMQLRDWLILAALVGSAAVVNYRVGENEKAVTALKTSFEKFEAQYVRKDVFDTELRLVRAQIELAKVQGEITRGR